METSSSPRLGTVIFATSGVDPENEAIEYSVASGVDDSYDLGTPDLFGMHTQTKRKKSKCYFATC